MYGQTTGRGVHGGYGSSYALGDLGWSVGGFFKGAAKVVGKVVASPVRTAVNLTQSGWNLARGDIKGAGRELKDAGKAALPAAAVIGGVLAAPYVGAFALTAGKLVASGAGKLASGVDRGVDVVKGRILERTVTPSSDDSGRQASAVNTDEVAFRDVRSQLDLNRIFNPASANMTLTPITPAQQQQQIEPVGIPMPLVIGGVVLLTMIASRR